MRNRVPGKRGACEVDDWSKGDHWAGVEVKI